MPLLKRQYRSISDTNLSELQFFSIICPNLRIGVRNSLLNPDKDGWVSSEDLRAFLEYTGVKTKSVIENILIVTGEPAVPEPRKGFINLTQFKGGNLDHGSSSGIINNPEGFSEERLQHLLSFASEDGTLRAKNLAKAGKDFNKCPVNYASTLGSMVQNMELGAMLRIYGRKDNEGLYFTTEDVIDIWRDNRFPSTWKAPQTQYYWTLNTIIDTLKISFLRLF